MRRLSDRIATLNAANEEDDLDLGVSCGIASYETGKRIEEIIELADHRMYLQKAKKAHREDSLASR